MPRKIRREPASRLLSQIRNGSEHALAELVESCGSTIRGFAKLCLGPKLKSSLDPEDVLQLVHETLLLAMRSNKLKAESIEEFTALAYKIARGFIALRARQLRRSPVSLDDDQDLAFALLSREAYSDPALTSLIRDEVAHALKGLSDVERKLLEGRLLDFDTSEVAAQLHMDPKLLRMYHMRLRERLRSEGVVTDQVD